MEKRKNSVKLGPHRIDFVQEIISSKENDDGSIIYEAMLIPNPKRYEIIEKDGEKIYKDKNTGIMFSSELLENLSSKLKGVPIYYTPPKTDYCAYLIERKRELLEHWDEKYTLDQDHNRIKDILESLSGRNTQIIILYVDLEGSTKLSSILDPDVNLKIIKIFLMEMAQIIDNFNGYVLKYIGDCVIGIFYADTNFSSMCDNAIQAAMIMGSVVQRVINPIFKEKGLPQIGYHIGLDIGVVKVDKVGAMGIAAVDDIIGYPMNLTAKIQSKAGHNEILLGNNLFKLIHYEWQKDCEKLDLSKDWTVKDPQDNSRYDVYRFNTIWNCKCVE